MDTQAVDPLSETILRRIDDIIQELEALRKMVRHTAVDHQTDVLVQQLYGALGQGNWDEYDVNLDWQRFDT